MSIRPMNGYVQKSLFCRSFEKDTLLHYRIVLFHSWTETLLASLLLYSFVNLPSLSQMGFLYLAPTIYGPLSVKRVMACVPVHQEEPLSPVSRFLCLILLDAGNV